MNWTRYAFDGFRTFLRRQRPNAQYYVGAAVCTPLAARQLHAWSRSDPDAERPARPIYVWGNNLYGLADPASYGKEEAVRYPRQVACWQDVQLRSVAMADKHAAAVDSAGNVYQWGESFWKTSGIFGTFQPVCTLKGHNCTAVRANESGVYAVDQDGGVIVLGLDARQPHYTVQVGEPVVDVQAGKSHLIALGRSGAVYTGSTNRYGNIFGQLGRGPTESTKRALEQVKNPSILPETIMSVVQGWPRPTERVIEQEAVTVDPIAHHSTALFPDIQLQPVDGKWWEGRRAVQVAAGDHHSLVLTESGRVYGFGSNEMLQLGIGQYDPDRAINPYPVLILKSEAEKASRATFIACGAETSYFVVDSDARTMILAAGYGQYGQLGNKSWTHAQGLPGKVNSISHLTYYNEQDHRVSPIRCLYVSAGGDHAAAVMDTFTPGTVLRKYGYDVYVWGANKCWQLGIANKRNNVCEPTSLEPPDPAAGDVDYTDLALSKSGPTSSNPEHTLTFVGGQLQILPDEQYDADDPRCTPRPVHQLYCGRDVTIIY